MKEKSIRTILGIPFFTGTIDESLDLAKEGGLVVMPSGPNLADLPSEPEYQEAVKNSDLALLDSGFKIFVVVAYGGAFTSQLGFKVSGQTIKGCGIFEGTRFVLGDAE